MTSHRSRFLASLSERLQSDLAAHGENGEETTSPPWLEHTGEPAGNEPAAEGVRGDRLGRPAAGPLAPGQERTHVLAAPADITPPIGPLVAIEREHPSDPAVPWSETGMPLRLREAIASVRRVSHEMDEPPDETYAAYARTPFVEDPPYLGSPSDEITAGDEPSPDGLLEGEPVSEYDQIPLGDVSTPRDAPELLSFDHDDAAHREPAADDELILGGDHVEDDGAPTRFGARAGLEEPPAVDELTTPDEDAAFYQRGWREALADDPAYREPAPGEQMTREQGWLDDDGRDSESAPAHWEEPGERPSRWHGATKRYGLPVAAFAVAIAFVALAGLGLGILSSADDVVGPLARDALRAFTEPTPRSNAQDGPAAGPERPAEPGELVTVRVEPAPVAVVPEPAPPAPISNSALPLPPPPKPILRAPAEPASSERQLAAAVTGGAPADAGPSERQLAAAVDDAAAALLESEAPDGPFQPLFTKLSASEPARTRVFVHYSADVVGAPATAMHLVRHLKTAGFAVEVRAIEFPIPTNSIRYFFDSDRAQAEALRTDLEGQLPGDAGVTVMDFTSYQPRPRPGLIEIWLRA